MLLQNLSPQKVQITCSAAAVLETVQFYNEVLALWRLREGGEGTFAPSRFQTIRKTGYLDRPSSSITLNLKFASQVT